MNCIHLTALVAVVLMVFPVYLFYCVKLGTYACLCGRAKFEQTQKRKNSNENQA